MLHGLVQTSSSPSLHFLNIDSLRRSKQNSQRASNEPAAFTSSLPLGVAFIEHRHGTSISLAYQLIEFDAFQIFMSTTWFWYTRMSFSTRATSFRDWSSALTMALERLHR